MIEKKVELTFAKIILSEVLSELKKNTTQFKKPEHMFLKSLPRHIIVKL